MDFFNALQEHIQMNFTVAKGYMNYALRKLLNHFGVSTDSFQLQEIIISLYFLPPKRRKRCICFQNVNSLQSLTVAFWESGGTGLYHISDNKLLRPNLAQLGTAYKIHFLSALSSFAVLRSNAHR